MSTKQAIYAPPRQTGCSTAGALAPGRPYAGRDFGGFGSAGTLAPALLSRSQEGTPMAARSLGSGMISFGLVAIPIRLFPAVVSERVSFHLLHAKCGTRIKYQTYCPT